MHYICTNNPQEQKQLELEFSNRNNYYLVPNKQSYFVSQMLSSICFEYFQSDIPAVVEKTKEMLTNSFNSTYCLSTFREVMNLLKKQRDQIKLLKEYLIQMNAAFAESSKQFGFQTQKQEDNYCDQLFMQVLKGQEHFLQNLEQLQLPLCSKVEMNSDTQETKTEKTMQSDLCSTKMNEETSENLTGKGTAKLLNFFHQSTFNRDEWKTDRKRQQGQSKQDSKEMSSFHKKGSTILDSNKDLSTILVKQMEYDLTRQINLGQKTQQKRHIQLEKHNYQKKIKDALVNYKLKQRKKK